MWDQASIHKLLDQYDKGVERAVVQIYRLQTADERAAGTTSHHNKVGFTAYDAGFLTSIAQQLLAGRQLSAKQMAITRNKMKRYWRQLADIANKAARPNPYLVQEAKIEPAEPCVHISVTLRTPEQEMERIASKARWEATIQPGSFA